MSKAKLAVIIVVILAIVIGFFVYWVMGKQEFEASWAAHQSCDCVAAVEGYKKVTSTYYLTFASYVNEARKNLAECEIVLAGDSYRDEKQYWHAINEYTTYLSEYSDGVMIPYVRIAAAETYWEWAADLRESGNYSLAISKYEIVLEDYADTPKATESEMDLINLYETAKQSVSEKRYCDAFPIFDAFIRANYVFTNESKAAMPEVLYYCGLEKYNTGRYKDAITIIEQLIMAYPDCLFVSDAEALLVDARVADLLEGDTGELPPPSETGSTTPGTAVVVISNDSPKRLEVLFSGPDSKSLVIERCAECHTYSLFGPLYCPEKGPKVNINLVPGVYNVVVRCPYDSSITPWSGEWTLESGAEYFHCFYIVTVTTFG